MRVIVLAALYLVSVAVASARQAVTPRHDADGAFNVALGVECAFCHTGQSRTDAAEPANGVARKMMAMVAYLNRGPLAGTSGVSCWSCHRGQRRPARIQTERWQQVQRERFIGPLAAQPDDVQLAMAVYSASLGVECAHCHVEGNWRSAVTPAHATASRMSAMMTELPKFLPPGARTQCFMCHQGQSAPATK